MRQRRFERRKPRTSCHTAAPVATHLHARVAVRGGEGKRRGEGEGEGKNERRMGEVKQGKKREGEGER